MTDLGEGQQRVKDIVATLLLPPSVSIRAWTDYDFPAVQRMTAAEGWPTPTERPAAALLAWQQSWPALVATEAETVIGLLRSLSDMAVTTYVAELLVDPSWRGRGIGSALLTVTQYLYPNARLDLLATTESETYYTRAGFRPFVGFRRFLPRGN